MLLVVGLVVGEHVGGRVGGVLIDQFFDRVA